MKYPLVHVRWMDSRGAAPGWSEVNEDQPLQSLFCESIGWKTREDEFCVVIAPHRSEGDPDQFCGNMIIPKCAISGMVEIANPQEPLNDEGLSSE